MGVGIFNKLKRLGVGILKMQRLHDNNNDNANDSTNDNVHEQRPRALDKNKLLKALSAQDHRSKTLNPRAQGQGPRDQGVSQSVNFASRQWIPKFKN